MIQLLNSMLALPAQQALNHILRSDPFLAESLQKFCGKVIAVKCRQPNLDFTLCFHQDGLQLLGTDNDSLMIETDAALMGKSIDLLRLLITKDDDRPLADPALEIYGDASLVNDLYFTVSNLDIDWQDHLGPLLGDVLSHELDQAGRNAMQWHKQTQNRIHHNLAEYIKEERRITPSPVEAEGQFKRIGNLTLWLDRLMARTKRLTTTIQEKTS